MLEIRPSRTIPSALAIAVTLWTATAAHETKHVGDLRFTMGWADEPTFSGIKNAVEIDVIDNHGMPVPDRASLAVEVSFGHERITLPLAPARGRPGHYRAPLLPTRPGTYTFRVTGKVKDLLVDVSSTCSDMTFSCVGELAEIQFPAKDPSTGQLAERVNRALPRAERAMDAATSARTLAMAGTFGAALALFGTVNRFVRRRRQEG